MVKKYVESIVGSSFIEVSPIADEMIDLNSGVFHVLKFLQVKQVEAVK